MKSSRCLFLLSTLSTMSLLGTNYSWVTTNTTGNWSNAADWTPAGGPPIASTDTATFPTIGTPATVTVDGIFAVGSLTFSSTTSGYTLTPTASNSLTLGGGAATPQIAASGTTSNTVASPLTLAGNILINQVSSGTLTLSGGMSGGFTVTQQGTGTTILSGTNSYTGSTTISSGTWKAGAANGFAAASAHTVTGTLDLGGFNNTISSLNGGGTVTNSGGSSSTLSISNGGSFSGVIQNGISTTAITLTGGTLSLSNANTYTGDTTITAGTVALTGIGALAATGAVIDNGMLDISGVSPATSSQIGDLSGNGTVFLGNNTLILGTANSTTFSGVIANGVAATNGLLQFVGTGTLTLSGNNTYTGSTTINAGGTIKAGTLNAFAPGSAFIVAGTLDLGGFNNTINSLSGANTGIVTNSGASAPATLSISNGGAYSGNIQNGSGSSTTGVTLTGGTLTLSGTNTYSGATTVTADGILLAGAGTAFSSTSAVILEDSGQLNLSTFSNTINSLSGGVDTIVTIGSGAGLTITGAGGGTFEFDGSIQGTGGSLTLNSISASTLILTNSGNNYSGGTTISNGTLALEGSGALLSTGPVVDNAPATFDISGISASSTPIGNLTGSGAVTLGNKVLVINNSGTSTFGGNISGIGGGLSIAGTGTRILSGTNTYTGPTSIASTLSLQAGSPSAFSPFSAFTLNGTLDLAGFNNTINSLSSAATTGSVTNSGGSAAVLTLSAGGTYAGTIVNGASNVGVTINGGTFALSNTGNTYSGATTINTGATLQAQDANAFSPNSNITLSGTGILNLQGFSNTIPSLTGSGASAVTGTAGSVLTITNGGTFSGSILGAMGLSLTTGGTLILSPTTPGSNTYSGPTNIGTLTTLQAGSTGAFSPNSPVTVTGTLNASTFASTINSLFGTGGVALGSGGVLTVANGGSFTGAISGLGGLTLSGGTLVLTPAVLNTYSGTTTIQAGATLQAGKAGAFSTASPMSVGGTLDLVGFNNTIPSLSGIGTVTNSANATPAVLTVSGGGSFGGVIKNGSSSSLGLTVSGGTLTLSGANTYTGGTIINAPTTTTLALSGTGSLSPAGNVTANGTFDISAITTGSTQIGNLTGSGAATLGANTLILGTGVNATFSGNISGSGGSLQYVGTGIFTLSGNNSYTGTTTINAGGTLRAGSPTGFAPASAFSVGGTLDLGGFSNTIGSLSGTGTVTNSGGSAQILSITNGGSYSGIIQNGTSTTGINLTGGTLVLSGTSNTYSGPTSVANSTLQAGANGAYSLNSPVTLGSLGILNLNNFNNTIPSLASTFANSQVILGTGTLTIAGGSATTFAGQINNAPCGGLTIGTVGSAGNLTITNSSSTYCGPTTIVNGTLTLGGNTVLPSATDVSILTNGTLANGAFTNSPNSITNAGAVTNASGGTLSPTTFTMTAGTATNSGTVTSNVFSMSGGAITNNTGANWLGSGVSPTISITGGNITNSGVFGSNSTVPPGTSISFTGGTLDNRNRVLATTYTQGASATLNLGFGTVPYGEVLVDNNINLNGSLIVTQRGMAYSESLIYPLLVSSAGTVNGTFSNVSFQSFTSINSPAIAYSLQNVSLFFGLCSASWIHPNDGFWGDSMNWNRACAPGVNGNENDTAILDDFMGPPTILVTLADTAGTGPQAITLFQLNFTAATTQYTIEQFSAASTITFDATSPSGVPQINVSAGSHFIEAPLILNLSTELLLTDGTQLTLNSPTTLRSATGSTAGLTVAQSTGSTSGSGDLVNNVTLTPYSMSIISATVTNNRAITPTNFMTIAGATGKTATVINGSAGSTINPAGPLTIGGAGTTIITNSGVSGVIGSTGNGNTDTIGGAGITQINNTGIKAQIGPNGLGSNLVLGNTGMTTVTNNGSGSQLGIFGIGGNLTIQGANTTIVNSGLQTQMGAFGTGGNVTMTGGSVSNQSGAVFQAGFGGTLAITGGTITNDTTSTVGSKTSNLNFTGGTLVTSGDVLAFNYTQGGTSTLQLNLTSLQPQAVIVGNVAASGTAVVGSNLVVDALPGCPMEAGDVVDLVTGAQGRSGQYSSVQFLNFPAGIIPNILYTPNAVELILAPTVTPNSMGSLPEMAFISINETDLMLERQLFDLHRRVNKRKKKKGSKETAHFADAETPLLAEADLLNEESLISRIGDQRTNLKRNQLSNRVAKKGTPTINPTRFYIGPTDSLGHLNSVGHSQTAFNYNSVGVFTGIDHAFDNWGAGLAGDYSSTSATLDHHAGNFHVNQIHGSGYGTWVPPSLQSLAVDGIVGYAHEWYHTRRKAGTTLISGKAKGDTQGTAVNGLLGVEYIFSKQQYEKIPRDVLVTPYLNVQYIWAHIDSYHEHGAGVYDLKIHEQQARSLRSCLGLRFDYVLTRENVTFQPEINLAWQLEYMDHMRHLKFSPSNLPALPSVDTQIFGAGRNTAIIGVDFLITVYKVFEVELSYDFQGNSLYQNHGFYLGVGGNF